MLTVLHEHFHQLQQSQPGYFQGVEALGLSGGDQTGMWMLNYPFPYKTPAVAEQIRRDEPPARRGVAGAGKG